MMDEIREIKKYKSIRNEQEHYDLGDDAVIEWIRKYAANFRKQWEEKYGSIIDERKYCPNSSGRQTGS